MKLKWKENDITKYVTSVTWSGSARQAARTVAFSVAYSPNDKSVETLDIKLGDKIVFYPDSNQKVHFVGAVTERNRSSDAGELQYTAKDHMIHLLRSNGTYRFRNKTPEKITEMVCKDIGINVRNLAKTGLVLNKMFFQERPYYEIIMAAYTKVYRKNKKPYIAQMNGDALEVIEKGKTIPGFHIKQGERILESSYSENTDDMVNRVYVYNSSNKKIGILTNTRWANMYGIFQSAITVDSGNGKQEAMNELKGISKNASLTSTGDYRCVSGLGVIIGDSRTGLKGRFWIESDSHEWKNGSYTMKLDLEFKNIMDTQEEDEEQTSSSLSGLSESSALEDVLNQARSWIGIGENPPGSNHNEITVLYGMDAAWCCMYIWACFNKSGHADVVKAVDRDNVGVTVDTFHFHEMCSRLEDLRAADGKKIFAYHLNDCEDLPLGSCGDDKRLWPGEGVVDHAGIAAALKEIGFDGVCTIEEFRPEYYAMSHEDNVKKAAEVTRDFVQKYFG